MEKDSFTRRGLFCKGALFTSVMALWLLNLFAASDADQFEKKLIRRFWEAEEKDRNLTLLILDMNEYKGNL